VRRCVEYVLLLLATTLIAITVLHYIGDHKHEAIIEDLGRLVTACREGTKYVATKSYNVIDKQVVITVKVGNSPIVVHVCNRSVVIASELIGSGVVLGSDYISTSYGVYAYYNSASKPGPLIVEPCIVYRRKGSSIAITIVKLPPRIEPGIYGFRARKFVYSRAFSSPVNYRVYVDGRLVDSFTSRTMVLEVIEKYLVRLR